ncbi:MAG: SPOR domain-containing protein [Treponema sp.]|nr:SPOR domain-containing protein [Treponema sp.]
MVKPFFFAVVIIVINTFFPVIAIAQSGTAAQSGSAQVSAHAVGISLEVEIQNIERELARQGIPPVSRHAFLVRLARLRQLSGDIEGAARNWLEAAAAIPGSVDDEALLNCAYCLAAMGEWDRAAAALEPLLIKSPRARFLDLSIKAIRSGDITALAAIADNPAYSEMKAEIIFVLWKITRGSPSSASQAERWRQRLLSEFPQTVEGRLAAGASSSSVIIRPSPFWLFAGGLDSLPLIPTASEGRPVLGTVNTPLASQPPAAPTQVSSAVQTASAPATSAPSVTPSSSTASPSPRLQTGIFSRQSNAQAQFQSLGNAGFSPSIERRIVNGSEMWAVTVPAGANQTATMNNLRAAGFDSFLIR